LPRAEAEQRAAQENGEEHGGELFIAIPSGNSRVVESAAICFSFDPLSPSTKVSVEDFCNPKKVEFIPPSNLLSPLARLLILSGRG
jgi:hypothetical protein